MIDDSEEKIIVGAVSCKKAGGHGKLLLNEYRVPPVSPVLFPLLL